MNYVEWLRVRNALRVTAICLGVSIVIALVVRISIAAQFGSTHDIVNRLGAEKDTVTTHSVVDGFARTTLTNAREHTVVVIEDQPDGSKVIQITEPGHSNHATDVVRMGPVSVSTTESGGVEKTTIETNRPVPFGIYAGIAAVIALIIATVLGAPFAKENDGHLEIAFLKPVSRTANALAVVLADCVGILIAEVMTIVAFAIMQAFFEVPHFDFSGINSTAILLAIALPLSWYAFLNASTASLKRGAGAVVGLAWPAAFVSISLAGLNLGTSITGQTFHTIFWSISRIFPLTYIQFEGHGSEDLSTLGPKLLATAGILTGLFLVYGALAVVQWRRVEA
jgi:ABC-type transport system involved in cytochrome c biogenesis permease component